MHASINGSLFTQFKRHYSDVFSYNTVCYRIGFENNHEDKQSSNFAHRNPKNISYSDPWCIFRLNISNFFSLKVIGEINLNLHASISGHTGMQIYPDPNFLFLKPPQHQISAYTCMRHKAG